MITGLLKKVFGTKHDREAKKLLPIVEAINRFDEGFASLSVEDLRNKTMEFRRRIRESTVDERAEYDRLAAAVRQNEDPNQAKALIDDLKAAEKHLLDVEREVLDEILPEAFACVKQACRRLMGTSYTVCGREVTWDMIPYDVQMIGGIVLHQGKIAEMATGEGKTLVAVAPIYLNALTERGVHLVTVNDYLALRDKEWMGKVYEFLGLSVGVILNDMNPSQDRRAHV